MEGRNNNCGKRITSVKRLNVKELKRFELDAAGVHLLDRDEKMFISSKLKQQLLFPDLGSRRSPENCNLDIKGRCVCKIDVSLSVF